MVQRILKRDFSRIKGTSFCKQGTIFCKEGTSFPKKGHCSAKKGASSAQKGLHFAEKGLNSAKKGALSAMKGAANRSIFKYYTPVKTRVGRDRNAIGKEGTDNFTNYNTLERKKRCFYT